MIYCVLDTELGGPNGELFSLLSLSLKIYEGTTPKTATFKESLNLFFKHPVYRVSPEGMAINKIDLAHLDKVGITLSAGGSQLYPILKKYGSSKDNRIKMVGHGVSGDIRTIFFNKLISEATWKEHVDLLTIDTLQLATALRGLGFLPANQSLKLKDLCDHANLGEFDYHTADGDVDANWELLKWYEDFIVKVGTNG